MRQGEQETHVELFKAKDAAKHLKGLNFVIENWQIREILRDPLGSAVVDQTDLCDGVGDILRAYAPYREKLPQLAEKVENCIFNRLYETLGQGMSARMDNGASRRIRMAELPDLTDRVLEVLFDQMKVYSVNYEVLHEYALQTGSIAAMRVLVRRFGSLCTPGEKEKMAAILQERGCPVEAPDN